jgi:aromatic-L-amino-acid decarboxylase
MTASDLHMTPEEFRRCGHAAVDWVARYMEQVEEHPVLSQVRPGEIREGLPPHPPDLGEPFEAVLRDLDRIILPGITHWQSPNFFAFVPGNASGPAMLGDLVSAGLGVQGMMWATSPACTELETHVLDWLVEMLDLPEKFLSTSGGGGVIQDTGSSSSLCAMLAARERATGFQSNHRGVDRPFVAYASPHTHSSIQKAAGVAGIGRDNLRLIDVDGAYAMRPDALERAVEEDLAMERLPFLVVATLGTTSSHAIDPLRPIGEICRRHGLWLHVDAAHIGTAALCPEFRWIQDGLELADSYFFNPHKWMLTNLDCSCFYVADREVLTRTLSVTPEYLRTKASDSGGVFDYRDWHIPLGRRFRALKLWFVIRHYGVEGLCRYVREHVKLAQEFVGWIEQDDRFELAAPAPLSLVCFRHVAGDEVNQRVLDEVNASGKLYITHTKLDDQLVLRFAVGAPPTRRRHVERAWAMIQEKAAAIAG